MYRSSLSANGQNQVLRPYLKASLSYRKLELCMNARRHTFLAFSCRPPEARLKAMIPFINFSLRDFYVFFNVYMGPRLHLKFDFFSQEHEHIMTGLVRSSNFSTKSLSENFYEIARLEIANLNCTTQFQHTIS